MSLKSKVFMSPAVWFQTEGPKQYGVTKTETDLLLLQSNLNPTIVRCYTECLIHVSQARYRLTMHQKITQWILLHAWGRMNIYLMHNKTFRWRLRPKLVILITSYDIITKQRQLQNTLYKNTVPSLV